MIIFADLHLDEKSADTVFNQVLPGLHEAVLKDKDSTLACLGDFYNLRYKVDVSIQNRVFEYFEELNNKGIRVILLPGNHDQINEAGDNALQPLATIPRVSVFSNPVLQDGGLWLPYRKNKEEYLKYKSTAAKTVFTHHGIRGFEIGNGIVDENGVDPLVFGKMTVITGHYHKRQSIGNVHYVGSPYQVNAGEAEQDKGYCVWDDNNLAYVNTNWGKRYYNSITPEVKQGDTIRVKAPKGVNLEKFKKGLNLPEGVECVIEPTLEGNEQRLTGDLKTFTDYALAYVDQFGNEEDRLILKEVFREIVS